MITENEFVVVRWRWVKWKFYLEIIILC